MDDIDEDNDEQDPELDEDPDRDMDTCCLGEDCLNPHPYHLASECFDLEMAQAAMSEDPSA